MFKIGSLCTGYGGLDMAVEAYFNAETVWTSDIDKYASIVIKERIGKPNLGDLKAIDWTQVEPIDILTAGYPCQPFSTAGSRKGTEDERHIFPYIMQAIGILRPRVIVLENVRGHLSLGFKEVLQRLAQAGYDARWQIVRASDAGAPHQRAKLFVIAWDSNNSAHRAFSRISQQRSTEPTGISSNVITDTHSTRFQGTRHEINDIADGVTANANRSSCQESRRTNRSIYGTASEIINGSNRQKRGLGFEIAKREVPSALADDKLNPKFVEYIMGLPDGWVTDLPISRTQQLKILGNGVVPQQAYLALQLLCDTPNIERDL
jgi:DNA (cytosine-5)-methyltransferase 1